MKLSGTLLPINSFLECPLYFISDAARNIREKIIVNINFLLVYIFLQPVLKRIEFE